MAELGVYVSQSPNFPMEPDILAPVVLCRPVEMLRQCASPLPGGMALLGSLEPAVEQIQWPEAAAVAAVREMGTGSVACCSTLRTHPAL